MFPNTSADKVYDWEDEIFSENPTAPPPIRSRREIRIFTTIEILKTLLWYTLLISMILWLWGVIPLWQLK